MCWNNSFLLRRCIFYSDLFPSSSRQANNFLIHLGNIIDYFLENPFWHWNNDDYKNSPKKGCNYVINWKLWRIFHTEKIMQFQILSVARNLLILQWCVCFYFCLYLYIFSGCRSFETKWFFEGKSVLDGTCFKDGIMVTKYIYI